MSNVNISGKRSWIIAVLALAGLAAGETARRLRRRAKQKQRQKKVDNSPIIRTKSFEIVNRPSANYDLVQVSEEELSGKTKLSEAELQEFKSFMSSAIGMGMQTAMAIKGTGELLKCNIPISELYQINGNPDQLRAFVLKDGKFDQQAILSPAGLKALAPLLVFQCMAAVTSQYYQQVITERLDEVNEKLDLLIEYLESKDQAEMKANYTVVKELFKKSSYDIADKARADKCYDSFNKLRIHYKQSVENTPLKLAVGHKNSDKDEADAKLERLTNERYFANLAYAMSAEQLFMVANLLRLKIAKAMKNEEDMQIALASMNTIDMEAYMQSFDSVKHDVLGYLNECLNDATIKKDDIKNSIAFVERTFGEAEKKIVQTAKIVNGDVTTYFRILPDGKSEVYVDK